MAKKNKQKTTSKRFDEVNKLVDRTKLHTPDEAIGLLKKTASTKFDESVDLAVRLGIDPKKGEQNVRGITNLPHGTGKSKTVAVLCDGDDVKAAEDAGADFVGEDDLIKKIQGGWKEFDIMLATDGMGKNIGKIGKFLGPKTPNKRNGTVTTDIAAAVKEIKAATRIEYRIDKAAIIHLSIGKVSFSEDQIKENFQTAIDALIRAKPSGAKGRYLRSVTVSSTMGPGIKIDPAQAAKKSCEVGRRCSLNIDPGQVFESAIFDVQRSRNVRQDCSSGNARSGTTNACCFESIRYAVESITRILRNADQGTVLSIPLSDSIRRHALYAMNRLLT